VQTDYSKLHNLLVSSHSVLACQVFPASLLLVAFTRHGCVKLRMTRDRHFRSNHFNCKLQTAFINLLMQNKSFSEKGE